MNFKKILALIMAAVMCASVAPIVNYNDFTITASAASKYAPDKVKNLKVKSKTTSSVNLTWDKVKGCTGYVVFTYNPTNQTYKKVCAVTGNSAKISKLKSGTNYKLAVRSYSNINGKNYYSDYSSKLSVTTNKVQTSKPSTTKPVTVPQNPNEASYSYILNINTGKFHYKGCSAIGKMRESHKRYITSSHVQMVNSGYSPCGICKP